MAAYGHYFDEETKVVHSTKTQTELDDRGVGYVLFHSMKKSAKESLTAQMDAATGHRDSFKSILSRSIRVAIFMKNMGIQQGDVITICSYNHLHSAVPYLAAHFIGATIAPTDPTISIDDQKHLMNLVRPKLIFVSNGSEEMISKALAPLKFKYEIVTFARNKCNKYRTFASMIEPQDDEENFQPIIAKDPTATCVILFSSGTTGLPKGICLNHYLILNTFSSVAALKAMQPRFLIYSTLYWFSAVVFQTVCFYFGMERVVCTHYDPLLLWEYVEKYQIHVAFLAPVQAIKSIKHLQLYQDNRLPLKILLMGGSAIAATYYQRLRDLLPGTLVVNGYGQTEVGFISLFMKPDDNYKKLDSVGVLAGNLMAKIVDPDTDEVLGLNKNGEICVKAPYAMNGYYNQNSSEVWDAEGFVKTGDLGYFDDDLCLYLTDRIKEMFKYQSWHIVPTKLEAILQSHPDVELAIVVGIPHPIEDNHAVGAVTLMSNAKISANELEEYVEERVDERNRLRAGVVILENMPVTPTGKIMRREAKEMLKKMVKVRS